MTFKDNRGGKREGAGMVAKSYAPQARYDAEKTKQLKLKLNLETDKDILEKLNGVKSKQGYIKELIRKDIKGQS